MAASGGAGGSFHVAQQAVHLGSAEAASGADGAVAGEAGDNGVKPGGQSRGLAQFGQFLGDVAQQGRGVGRAKGGRQSTDQHGTGAEDFEFDAEARQRISLGNQGGGLGVGQVDDGGEQQSLAGNVAVQHLIAQRLMGEAFMGRVLIDQDEAAIGGHSDHIGVEHLGDGGTKRVVGLGGWGFGDPGAGGAQIEPGGAQVISGNSTKSRNRGAKMNRPHMP